MKKTSSMIPGIPLCKQAYIQSQVDNIQPNVYTYQANQSKQRRNKCFLDSSDTAPRDILWIIVMLLSSHRYRLEGEVSI